MNDKLADESERVDTQRLFDKKESLLKGIGFEVISITDPKNPKYKI